MNKSYILAIESSCDDTSLAVVDSEYNIHANLISSQIEHEVFGGVLPELASRLHLKNILYLIDRVLDKAQISLDALDAVAVSVNPGLIGSLVVGLSFAKSLAWSQGLPLITVNHLLAHIWANHLEHGKIQSPYLALVVSGGHTEMVHFVSDLDFSIVGKTVDDAAGETFDKTAKLLGLGFPGGPIIDKLAKTGNPSFVEFPRAKPQKSDFDFSYSGLKTAVKQYLAKLDVKFIEEHKSDVSASIQAAIIDPLVQKSIRWCRNNNVNKILLAGGVAANSYLRTELSSRAKKYAIDVFYPSLGLCLDNAAMVGAAAISKLDRKLS